MDLLPTLNSLIQGLNRPRPPLTVFQLISRYRLHEMSYWERIGIHLIKCVAPRQENSVARSALECLLYLYEQFLLPPSILNSKDLLESLVEFLYFPDMQLPALNIIQSFQYSFATLAPYLQLSQNEVKNLFNNLKENRANFCQNFLKKKNYFKVNGSTFSSFTF